MTSTSEIAALAVDYPGWHVWRARSGSGAEAEWHATAHRAPRRLAAPDAPGLRALPGQREALRRERAA